jgi:magnesium chelatase subunit D
MTSFPFSAIVGSDDYKTALLANAVDPGIGGVLAVGERGTAKTTVARAVAALLPDRDVAPECAYSCAPTGQFAGCPDGPHPEGAAERVPARLVELPVGATLDRLVGGFDIGEALGGGELRFAPGLLAAANRNILYVDEVNLLADHLVDALLDAAASGVNRVERDGVGATHASRFVLVGTMNPEEGDLRPQFLDRFGLAVSVTASRDPAARAEIVRRRLAFERDPAGFAAAWLERDARLRSRVAEAQAAVDSLEVDATQLDFIAATCSRLGAQGLRADIVAARTAAALAALDGRAEVGDEHVRQALMLALPHRVADPVREHAQEAIARVATALASGGPASGGHGAEPPAGESHAGQGTLTVIPDSKPSRTGAGPLSPAVAAGRARRRQSSGGERLDSMPLDTREDAVDLHATLSATARRTGAGKREAATVEAVDLRSAVQSAGSQSLVALAIDTSGSLFASLGQAGLETALAGLLGDAQSARDRVALVTFGGSTAEQLSPPTRNHALVASLLARVEPGGTTPLADGICATAELVRRERSRHPGGSIVVLLMTDGRANVSSSGGDPLADAHRQAERLAALGSDVYVVGEESWHTRRLAERCHGRLITPWWMPEAAPEAPARTA